MDEPKAVADDSGGSPFLPARTPPLGIRHLMLWTFFCALYLVAARAVNSMQNGMPREFEAVRDTSNLFHGVVIGAAFAGAFVLVWIRVRGGPPMLREPGHWLLIVSALFYATYLPALLISLLFSVHTFPLTFLVYGLLFLPAPCVYMWAAVRTPIRSWRVIFVMLALVAASQCLYLLVIAWGPSYPFGIVFSVLGFTQTWGKLMLAGAVLIVALAELFAERRRDWLHWTGVVTHVAASVFSLLWTLVRWFL